MLEKIKNLFRIGGAKLGMVQQLEKIIDHPKISMDQEEYDRIRNNKQIYKSVFPNVNYLSSNGIFQEREFRSLNVSKVLSRKLAKLVFNDGCSVSVDDKKANEFLQDTFNSNKFRKNFGEELEAGYAIGGLVLRPYVDIGSKEIKIAYCRADTFYPLQSNTNDITEAVITTETQQTEGKDMIHYTLLEFHEWENGTYYIRNELYRSDRQDAVGVKVPLKTLEKYADLQEETKMEGFSRPLFVYIKLAGKNNLNISSPLSLGIIDNAKRQLKDINEKYDQFMWEIEEGRRKILASDHFFKVRYDEKGNPIKRFDSKTSVYQSLKSDEPFIDEFSPSLRSSEFIESINFILRIIEMQTGFSSGTFSFDGQSVKTATEIISENSETFSTRSDNVLIVEEALKELVITIFELAHAYGLYNQPAKLGVNIDFDDGVFQSQDAKADYYSKLVISELTSKLRAIQKVSGVTEKEAKEILSEIKAEQLDLDYAENEEEYIKKELGSDE
ncbi:poly(3-hydroxybutyrate) depolymerase [Carnobacterium divergens]|uniref:phage portal protein n=1 Tax=Carnobacterium divergens TaxID=2748 RepID=UPI000D42FC1E|nr:phage portal protein [Carnobacterium divergens]MCO6018255.1 phage portal protein [Carnobacterium divergens]TFI64617.1 poly(3-hydroxybutyrate) depolymerase [Carnobacterium divergens]TFI91486.1 poly(3-hydroxybutyrate) depolymerase [Carnobacterium divergens]TFJ06542.1 poly(3-hydroxybutyrate) depolymerase [Carnobacterium divergens]TFJ07895.1 poly(3-hydroxybutyrate) depolymerase [Carnobacterium divergens]